MKHVVTAAMAALLAVGLVGVAVHAEEEAEAKAEAPKGMVVTITGENHCLACKYKGDAEAADENYQHVNALMIAEATDADGKIVEKLAGKTVFYVPTKAAQPLMFGLDNAGKTVTVKGTVFEGAHVVRVENFELAASDDDDGWDDLPVGTLSAQQVL